MEIFWVGVSSLDLLDKGILLLQDYPHLARQVTQAGDVLILQDNLNLLYLLAVHDHLGLDAAFDLQRSLGLGVTPHSLSYKVFELLVFAKQDIQYWSAFLPDPGECI